MAVGGLFPTRRRWATFGRLRAEVARIRQSASFGQAIEVQDTGRGFALPDEAKFFAVHLDGKVQAKSQRPLMSLRAQKRDRVDAPAQPGFEYLRHRAG